MVRGGVGWIEISANCPLLLESMGVKAVFVRLALKLIAPFRRVECVAPSLCECGPVTETSAALRELWKSDAIGRHVVEPSLDFNKILADQKKKKKKNQNLLPLSAKPYATEPKTGIFRPEPSNDITTQD